MGAATVGGDWIGEAYAAESGHHRSYDDWFLRRLPPEPDDFVIDLGCGSGGFSARIAELVTEGRVLGVDPDPSMLEEARRHSQHHLEFVEGSALDLDTLIGEGAVDKVLSRAMLHWITQEDYSRVFEAVFAVLRPGGWFHSESAGAGNVPQMVEVLSALADRFETPALPSFPDPGLVFELMERAGFEIPDEGIRTVAQRRRFSRDQALGLLQTQGTVAVTRHVDSSEAESILAAAAGELECLRRSDGTFDQTFVRLEILARKPDRSI